MLKSFAVQSAAAVRVLLVFTVLLGVAYPLSVWAVSRLPGLHHHAEGSIVEHDGRPAGSALIGVDPVFDGPPARDPWFHTRPSATGGPPDSGGSNASAFNPGQVRLVRQRQEQIAEREGVSPAAVPADAVTASASGLDPDISVAYAHLQAARVARNNGLATGEVRHLIERCTSTRGIGVPSVNVLRLNLAVQARAH
ncbi:potassium-transporting ATPase subunit C [Prauserella muralis]|uniref:Potassium-transporting ATPase KdpC subunit n=1 Tax=Prauserella muralis TaxID=588067 RepID=A0A2V4B226_9PSEU|nr:potassium-transporting ATPase subunit C [Prauserella muralis]PXY28321.1 K+-transporting ATPase subunit C [Prauserella muralis]TWE23271.1 K+-transporting ATPase ATPase C chain [Prauserella muralis]